MAVFGACGTQRQLMLPERSCVGFLIYIYLYCQFSGFDLYAFQRPFGRLGGTGIDGH
jgi:hypothetical protein